MNGGPNASDDPEARADAAELELERAHRFLDTLGVPRDFRPEGARDPVDYSLVGRIELLFEEEPDGDEA